MPAPQDIVGKPGDAINAKGVRYIKIKDGLYQRIRIKDALVPTAVETACGLTKTKPTADTDVIQSGRLRDAYKIGACIPVTFILNRGEVTVGSTTQDVYSYHTVPCSPSKADTVTTELKGATVYGGKIEAAFLGTRIGP